MLRVAGLFAVVLGGCDTVDLGPVPADVNACRPSERYFLDQVWPNFLAKDYGGKHCYDARCHDGSGTGGSLVLTPPTSAPQLPLPSDWELVYRSATEQMECSLPTQSKLLTKPEGVLTHGGGMLIQPGGPESMIVQMWVTAP